VSERNDYPAKAEGAALGARLRRLSTAIEAEVARVYAAEGVAFEQRWFGVNGAMTVGALADALGIGHASVSETRHSLEAAGHVHVVTDGNDGRRRILTLSTEGEALVDRLRSLWRAFDDAASALDKEAGDVTAALDRLGEALSHRSLRERIYDAMA